MLRIKMKSDKTETHFLLWLKGTLVWLNWVRKLLTKESLKCDFSLCFFFSHKYHFLLHFNWQKCMIFLRDLWKCFCSDRKSMQNYSLAVVPLTQPLKHREGRLLMHSCASETYIYFPYSWMDEANGAELAMMPLRSIPPPHWDTSTSLHFYILVS